MTIDGKIVKFKRVDRDDNSNIEVSVRDVSTEGNVVIRFSNPIYAPLNFT